MHVTKFSVWNRNIRCRQKLPNWNTSQRFLFLSAFPNFQRFSWNLNRASWLSWLDDLKMLTSMFCCTSRSVSSPWWKKKEASESWTSRLEVRVFADKSKGKTLYPLIKDGTTKTRFPIARHRREPSSLRCVTRMLRNSTAQKEVIFLLFCLTFSSCFHQGAKSMEQHVVKKRSGHFCALPLKMHKLSEKAPVLSSPIIGANREACSERDSLGHKHRQKCRGMKWPKWII